MATPKKQKHINANKDKPKEVLFIYLFLSVAVVNMFGLQKVI